MATERWAFQLHSNDMVHFFKHSLLMACHITVQTIRIVMLGIPEIGLYSITFAYIIRHTNKTALAGILNPEVIKRRRQKNILNIKMTFLVWLVQFFTNIIYLIIIYVFYGKIRFYHSLLAVLTICLNFTILPLFYIAMADEDFKFAILNKEYSTVMKLFLKY